MATRNVSDSPLASLLPDEMVSGGLADDFDGIVREARWSPWDYNGNVDKPVLAVKLRIERLDVGADADDEERFVTQHWSGGALEHFRPSSDGKSANSGEGMEIPDGYYAIRVGQRTALNNNTNAAQLMRSILDAQFPRDKFSNDIRFMEGIKGHFNRLPPDKKGGQFKDQTAEQREKASKRDVLCLTRFDGIEKGAAAPKSGAGTATSSTTSAAGSNGGSIDEKLAEVVKGIVKPGAPAVKKSALSGAVLKAMKGDKDVNAAVKRVTATDFLEGLAEFGILFDADAGTVEAVGE